jgi:hypothetical protein
MLPFVLLYQAWSYYVFRKRVSTQGFQPQAPPAAPAVPSPPAGTTAGQER